MPSPSRNQADGAVGRFGFLDAARGVAVLAVLLVHVLDQQFPAFADFSRRRFNLGVFGVILFFLVSGYIIPVSLERSHSLKRFWVSRIFRLFPLYLAVLAASLLLWKAGVMDLAPEFVAALPGSLLVNLTMLQELFRVPHALGLFWTLGYEMLFYFLCSALFLCRLNRRTLTWCWLGVGVLAGADVLAPLLLRQPLFKIASFWVLTFFIGTLHYRVSQGQASRRAVRGLLLALAAVVGIGAYLNFVWLHQLQKPTGPHDIAPLAYLSAWAAAYLCFAVLLRLAPYRFPRGLRRLGEISYSIYLIQGIVLSSCGRFEFERGWLNVVALSALCVALASLTYRLIERPGIAVGRWLVSSRPPAPAPTEDKKDPPRPIGRAA